MARVYGQIYTSIWKDPDFVAMPSEPQRLFMLLFSQGDISSCGTLSLTLRRWSKMASDTTIDSLSDALSILVSNGFAVVDEDAEEVLIRSFIKWDKGYKVPKRLMAIRDAAQAVTSTALQQVINGELAKLGIPIDTPSDSDTATDIDIATVPGISNVSRGGTGNREPGAGSRGASDAPPPPVCSKHPDGTEQPCRACGAARKKREKWDTENRQSAEQFAEYLKTQPECTHGVPGGNIERPNIGTPSCAQCRRRLKDAS
jgi:hypothetical protein